jgi:hypothetical protein
MFVVAGEVVAAAAGMPWEDFVTRRILGPLGMNETRIGVAGYHGGPNVAVPHSRGWRLAGAPLRAIAPTRDDTWAAAAGLRSSATDLSRWVAANLDGGKANGKALWSAESARELWSAQTVQRVSDPPEPVKGTKANFAAYGLGWSLRDYRGRKVVSHGGALTGMLSTVVIVPELQLGVVVLTNQEEGGAMSAIVYRVLDHYLKVEPTDWIAAYKAVRDERLKKDAEAERKQQAARHAASKPSLEPAKYAGEFFDAWYGKARIEAEGGGLVLRMTRAPAMVADLTHWHYDTFKAVFRDSTIPDAFVTFGLDHEGKVERVTMRATSEIADFSFDYHDLLFRPAPPARK